MVGVNGCEKKKSISNETEIIDCAQSHRICSFESAGYLEQFGLRADAKFEGKKVTPFKNMAYLTSQAPTTGDEILKNLHGIAMKYSSVLKSLVNARSYLTF